VQGICTFGKIFQIFFRKAAAGSSIDALRNYTKPQTCHKLPALKIESRAEQMCAIHIVLPGF
jgi:hypothetical protein